MDKLKAYKKKLSITVNAYNNEQIRLEDIRADRKIEGDNLVSAKENADRIKSEYKKEIEIIKAERNRANSEFDDFKLLVKEAKDEKKKDDEKLKEVKDKILEAENTANKILDDANKKAKEIVDGANNEKKEIEESFENTKKGIKDNKEKIKSSNKKVDETNEGKKVLLNTNKVIADGNKILESKKAELKNETDKLEKTLNSTTEKKNKAESELLNATNDIIELDKKKKSVNNKIDLSGKKLNIIRKNIETEEAKKIKLIEGNKRLENEKFIIADQKENLKQRELEMREIYKKAGVPYPEE